MIYTIAQVKEGKTEGLTKSDLKEYAKINDTCSKTDYESLKVTVSKKLDQSPEHTHSISAISQLKQQLDNKLDVQLYDYKSLIKDSENIDYLKDVKIDKITIANYTITTDNEDLEIKYNNSIIASYNGTSWNFNNIDLTEKFKNIDAVLLNHHDAILALSNNESSNIDTTDQQ
jgi:hypothetical protein